jgi:hypothetical protein
MADDYEGASPVKTEKLEYEGSAPIGAKASGEISVPKQPEQPGFMQRVQGDVLNRANEGADAIVAWKNKEQSAPATALQLVGKMGGGTAGDIISEAGKSLIPSSVSTAVTNAAQGGAQKISDLIDSPVAEQAAIKAAKAGQYINQVKENNPNATRSIESAGDILNFLFGAKVGGEPAASALTKTGKAALPVAKDAIAKGMSGVTPKIDPGLLPVVNLAKKYDIPLSLDEVTGSRALKSVQKVGQDLPFSGQKAFRDKQMAAWNKGILKTMGEEGDKLTPEAMDKAYKRLGSEFDNLGKGRVYNVSGTFNKSMMDIMNDAEVTKSADARKNFSNVIKQIKKEIKPDGTITGEQLNKLRAKINGYIRSTDNYDTKVLLGDVENHIIDTLTSGDEKIAKDFAKTKQQYKNFIALEPLVQKGKAGNISPTGLSTRVAKIYNRAYTTGNAGDIGELARVGKEVLPELGGSDTQNKILYGLGAGGAAFSHPLVTGAALGGNRAFQEFINRNQSLIHNLAKSNVTTP